MLKIYIPKSNFDPGGIMEGYNMRKTEVNIPMRVKGQGRLAVTTNITLVEDWNFQPESNLRYHELLDVVHKGLIVIERDGVVQTPTDLTNLFKEFFQEL